MNDPSSTGKKSTRKTSTGKMSTGKKSTGKKSTGKKPENKQDGKICNDSVHGFISLPPICYRIIDTPQFQRLRNIKQLGGAYYVYPGASHNRFEHSIGVCHLAGKLVKKLKAKQPKKEPKDSKITKKDVLCVQIAGLCHDLGHGPLSHLFDKHVIPKLDGSKWTHEDASSMLFDYMLEKESGNVKLIKEFRENFHGELKARKNFIKELIKPPKEHTDPNKKKKFLYEIVANESTKIDVDKWDYFIRDCHHLGLKNAFDHRRLIKSARVIDDKLCFRDKEIRNVYEMFHTRETLHRQAYQHKTTLIIEHMIAKALRYTCKSRKWKIEGEEPRSLRKSIEDPVAYTSLDDTVLWLILNPRSKAEKNCKELKKARPILQKVQRREHPRFICPVKVEADLCHLSSEELDKLRKDIKAKVKQEIKDEVPGLVVKSAHFDYGNKAQNPLHAVRFYSKHDPDTIVLGEEIKDQVPIMIPTTFKETVFYFYSDTDEHTDIKATSRRIKEIVKTVSDLRKRGAPDEEITESKKKMRKEESS